jgi:uncharacterized protein (TIGR03118 family)
MQEAALQQQSADLDQTFKQTNLVSDGFVPAAHIDHNLVNPWGVAFGPKGPFWVADNNAGVATFYNGAGKPLTILGRMAITIAPPHGQTGLTSPTGEVFNLAKSGFDISSGGKSGSSIFIFATEDGTISGWNPSVNAGRTVLAVDNFHGGKGAVYKGLAIAKTSSGPLLYAANFRAGTVDVFDSHFKPVKSFTDHNVPKGFAPFDVKVLDGHLFVTFAKQNAEKHDDVAGPGNGFVDEFDFQGHLLHRIASKGPLNSPWGLAIAPKGFGDLAGDLLVGNFGDGTINVFNLHDDKFLGKLTGANGHPIVIGDLWALTRGTGAPGSDPNKIYFTAGVKNEAHGLFGSLSANPDLDRSAVSALAGHHMHG